MLEVIQRLFRCFSEVFIFYPVVIQRLNKDYSEPIPMNLNCILMRTIRSSLNHDKAELIDLLYPSTVIIFFVNSPQRPGVLLHYFFYNITV